MKLGSKTWIISIQTINIFYTSIHTQSINVLYVYCIHLVELMRGKSSIKYSYLSFPLLSLSTYLKLRL